MGTWKERTFSSKAKAQGYKRCAKESGLSTTRDIKKKKGKYVIEVKF